ncbi:MAG: hypothetical protein BWY23_01317 [Spirochaetes bacterium ADurb.Bin218]|jgi:hypothetical protein|nr:STAS-like domain-containing protein [Spirochaetota bacterium]OQA97941.1 MAG: hypothetical protein BWY23_01317 [Spirochaetes bacterium ADurb.Bin218]HOQ11041.1 DUF4325 domain-containing protein [Spirochaetota bacterium]HOV07987.1 DUF4325 domain-containing protein [Spirochaetota bacterium]
MIILVEKLARECKIKSQDLITRPIGRSLFEKAMEKIKMTDKGETVILDFENIKVIDSSFIDEFIVRLIEISSTEDFYIKLKDISLMAEINIDSVFHSYSNYKDKRIAAAREELGRNNKYYIGPLTQEESDIIDYLKINHHSSLSELLRFSGIEEIKIMPILQELYSLRVIKKINNEYYSV